MYGLTSAEQAERIAIKAHFLLWINKPQVAKTSGKNNVPGVFSKMDYSEFFKKYESIVKMAEGAFEQVKNQFPDKVTCKEGCSDCCHALFDLTLIEALYLNHNFNKKFEGKARHELIEKANKADRKIYKLKKEAYKDAQKGSGDIEILGKMSMERVRCPLLNDENKCDLYEYRPLTCRIYGIPTSTQGVSHTCGRSGFVEGEPYPTVKMEIIYQKLYELSAETAKALSSKYDKLAEMLVPLSMALLTDYNDDFLGTTRDGSNE